VRIKFVFFLSTYLIERVPVLPTHCYCLSNAKAALVIAFTPVEVAGKKSGANFEECSDGKGVDVAMALS
jgi:hypothetical protein